jgi:hypothetical protein
VSRGRDDLVQPTLWAAAAAAPTWRLEGSRCPKCQLAAMRMEHASDVCPKPDPDARPCEACGAKRGGLCNGLAEGYAVCEGCGHLAQVWPDDMLPAVGAA